MRLAGQMKMGYYPTPECVTNDIINRLDINNDGWGVTLLDPSCGNADVLKIFKKKFPKMKCMGIELDDERAKIARDEIGCSKCIVKGDALNAIVHGKTQILFLNPPYDWVDENETGRLETLFIEKYLDVLDDNGVFIAVLPFFKPLIKELSYRVGSSVSDCIIIPFPKEEFGFKQFVLIGRKNDSGSYSYYSYSNTIDDAVNMMFTAFYDADDNNLYQVVIETAEKFNKDREDYRYQVPFSSIGSLRIINNTFDYGKVKDAIQKDKILHQAVTKVWMEKLTSKDKIRPLTNLRQGHLAMILAGGYINGVIEKDGKKMVIKGKVEQKTEMSSAEVREDGKLKTSEITSHAVSLKVLDLESGEISIVE